MVTGNQSDDNGSLVHTENSRFIKMHTLVPSTPSINYERSSCKQRTKGITMSTFKIEDGKLKQDGIDISETSSEVLTEMGTTILKYAKFRAAVEKAAVTCFGEQKKRKAPAKKAAAKPAEANPTPATPTPASSVPAATNDATIDVADIGFVDMATGEVF